LCAAEWAGKNNVKVYYYWPKWKTYGKFAGFKVGRQMLNAVLRRVIHAVRTKGKSADERGFGRKTATARPRNYRGRLSKETTYSILRSSTTTRPWTAKERASSSYAEPRGASERTHAGVGLLQVGQQPQEDGLAGAVWADQPDALAGAGVQGQVGEQRPGPKPLDSPRTLSKTVMHGSRHGAVRC
jgi:hypothetical protein